MSSETQRQRTLERLAREDHEQGCRNEPPFEAMTIQHRWVHENAAIRQYNRGAR
jgi:hypothetical protein